MYGIPPVTTPAAWSPPAPGQATRLIIERDPLVDGQSDEPRLFWRVGNVLYIQAAGMPGAGRSRRSVTIDSVALWEAIDQGQMELAWSDQGDIVHTEPVVLGEDPYAPPRPRRAASP